MEEKSALIVEDQAITALDIKCILKCCGLCNSIIASSGKKALKYIEEYNPSIVFLDVKLEDDISGIDVAKELKRKNIPFVFVSAFSDPENFRKASELNPFGIIIKPISKTKIVQIIEKFLEQKISYYEI